VKLSKELWTLIIDLAVSVAIEAITLWVAPEYQTMAHVVVAGLQGVAAGFVAEFRSQRRDEATKAEIAILAKRR
jgi:hypothetical protein